MDALDQMMAAFAAAGGDRAVLADADTAHLMVDGHRILSSRGIEGIEVVARETPSGLSATVRVRQGVRITRPVHLCFGMLHKKGSQHVRMAVQVEKDASVSFIAHCIFPGAEEVIHTMDADVVVGEGAEMHYVESHFHGLAGGVEAIPKAVINVAENGRYLGEFNLVSGRVGRLAIDYLVQVQKNGVVELLARVFGHGSDSIDVREKVVLAGENARGLIKTRVAVEDEASAEITGITEGNAAGARGHVDCMEIVKDHGVASAIPLVRVTNPLAKVTHEAAIGSVDKKQLETLMLHGLSPEEAVEVIVRGMLR
ncbi:MAG: SufD family Fe-S cluster assembly protein [Desulfurivibrionaceae bacterium]|nr:SufD family Fe-S cluster assembly protein [Desulfurivibrionaceae bacterium]